jgi:hypothetical protein
MEVTGRLHASATLRCRKGPPRTNRVGGMWALGPVWTLWRRVGCRSGLGRHGDEWAAGPVLDAMEASGLQGPVLDAMEASRLQVRSWTP